MSSMETLATLGFILCVAFVAFVASQSQSQLAITDCAPQLEACDRVYEASQKDMVQVDNYYQCLKRPQGCDFIQDEERERRIVKLKIFVANVCPSCRLGDKVWTTPSQSPDEMPDETCEDQIFTCTTHKDDSMTRFDMLQDAFVCVQRPRECSPHEEFLRQAVTNSIVNEMAMACPDCLVPNPPPSMYMGDMQPNDIPCMSVLTLCNAVYNVKETNYWSFESLYMCIAKIANCESDLEMTMRQQQMDVLMMSLKTMCPNCTMLTPTPPVQQTCLESVYHCSTHGIDGNFTVRYTGLIKVQECTLNLEECNSGQENNLRFHLVHHVRREMELECAHCDMPDIPDDVMDAVTNAMPPEHHSCREAMLSCQAIFNIRPRSQRRYQEMYHCLRRTENCLPEEMEFMERMADDPQHPLQRRKRSVPIFFEPLLASKLEVTGTSTCHGDIIGCQQEFQTNPGTCGNRLLHLTCLITLRSCKVWEEPMRNTYISKEFAIIQEECIPTDSESKRQSCYPAFLSCIREFHSSNRNERKATQFLQCLRQMQNCREWEESHRQEMLRAALKYLPAPDFSTEIRHDNTTA